MPKIDEKAYVNGRKAFTKGKSLRDMIEPIIAMDRNYESNPEKREELENTSFSAVLGFADAVLDHIRKR